MEGAIRSFFCLDDDHDDHGFPSTKVKASPSTNNPCRPMTSRCPVWPHVWSVWTLCIQTYSKHIMLQCFKFGTRRKSQSFHQFFPPLNSRGHREFPHPWCSENRGGAGTLIQNRIARFECFLRISGHLCHTNRDDFVESFWWSWLLFEVGLQGFELGSPCWNAVR